MAPRTYKDMSPEAEKRCEAGREACRRHYRRKKLGLPPLQKHANLSHMTPEEKADHHRKAKIAANNAKYNGLAKEGITSPSHVQHDEPLSRYIADKMIRQEAGISTRAGFNIIGDGCFRARAYPKHS